MLGAYAGLQRVAVVVGVLVSVAAVAWLERDADRPGGLRRRFVLGVPWGSLVALAFVLSVFLFLQGGLDHWYSPVTVSYSAWSYFYPLGVLAAAFSHDGSAHLIGNLTSGLVVLPLAEYVVGHFPTRRGTTSFDGPWRHPFVRAFVLFPAGVLVVGLLTALWSWGPIIGFSGVVFAAVGFALVRYPLGAVVALAAQGVVVTVYRSLLNPIVTREASRRFVRPGWAGIAVQGHALGLFLGATLAVALLWHRGTLGEERPRPLRIWLGTVLVATSLGLWQLWWILGPQEYVLFRALGALFVLAVGLLLTAAVVASDRPLLAGVPERLASVSSGLARRVPQPAVPRRRVAFALLAVPLLVMAAVAVPVNLNTVESAPEVETSVEVRDYEVLYAEGVPNGMVNVVQVALLGVSTDVRTSGVIVVSERRNVWSREVPPGRLKNDGRVSVVVGGPGWRETVVAVRRGWSAFGGGSTYKVWIGRQGERKRLAFTADPARADAVLAGYNVSVAPGTRRFLVRLSRNNSTIARAPIPAANESVTLRNVTFTRDGTTLIATHRNTTVTVASKETYD